MRIILSFFLLMLPTTAKTDLWGGDLPLLAQIVTNTLHTMMELEKQSSLMKDELSGIRDRIDRIQTISEMVQPSSWESWKDPAEALRRLKIIYHTLPESYRSKKAEVIEEELSKAMNLIARLKHETGTTFRSGKELERRGADSSPGVATKLTASGIGTLIAIESQNQAIQSHVVSLLAQILAEANERETRMAVTKSSGFSGISRNLGEKYNLFSTHVLKWRIF
ncbi:MAG: hypothetical protein K2X47_03040 [Bdellovibrionales bacterium]|nr:hypothetical protein [Bdellovibrionales bacterium]